MKNVVIILLASLLSACASTPETKTTELNSPPNWVAHPDKDFPSSRYLVAVGEGETRDDAIRNSKKQMAESFLVKVKSITNVNAQSQMSQNTVGDQVGESKESISKDLNLETTTSLRGAETKEVAKVGKTHYALLVLDKLNARSGLLMEANRIQAKLNGTLDGLEENFNQAKLQEAKMDLASFQELYAEASALGMSALVDLNSAQTRLTKIENRARGKNQKLNFSVKTLKGEEYFERDIQSCINDRGGAVFDSGKGPENTNQIQITVVERPQHMPVEGWTKIRFDVTAAIVQPSGKLARIQASQTESGRSRSAVLEAVSDKLSKELCDQMFNRISEMN